MKKAFVFRGSPASGKGTITEKFIHLLPDKVALLDLDTFRWHFHLTNRKVSEVSEDEHVLAYQNFLLILESYCINGGYDLVIEGLFAWDFPSPHGNMKDITSLLNQYGFDYKLFLLTGDMETLWKRNMERKYIVPREEFEMLYHNVMDKTGKEEIIINVGNMTLEDTLENIKSKALL
jgi:hypothetical protein